MQKRAKRKPVRKRPPLTAKATSRAKRKADSTDHGDDAPDIFARHASFCTVLSDEKRLRIMWFLGETERSVGQIAEHLGTSMQNTSQHLRVMRDKGAVHTRREGQTVYYRIANHSILDGCRLIRQGLIEEIRKGQTGPAS